MIRHTARLPISPDKISYASSGKTRAGRAFIRTLENLTGRRAILKRAERHPRAIDEADNFWAEMVDLFSLELDVVRGSLENIPSEGPLVLVSNHPFGILDGLFMGYILSHTRPDFRIVAHKIFGVAPQISDIILPVSFDANPDAVKLNLNTRKVAVDYLRNGGAIGIFPGGTVSTSLKPFGTPADPGWRSFTAKMITKSGATVVPLYFDGHNSRLFQIASRLNSNLRLALLINEFHRRIEDQVQICIGDPIPPEDMSEVMSNGRTLMDALRAITYSLAPQSRAHEEYGYEFEDIHRRA